MSENEPREVFLEVDASIPSTPADATSTAATPWLEPVEDPAASGEGVRRRKVRAVDRTTSASDQLSTAIVAALVSHRPLMAALWPDVPPAELLRTPPPDTAFQARCDFARRAIDATARRDAEARAQAEVAQRALQSRLEALGPEESRREVALAELRRAQVTSLEEVLRVLAGAPRELTRGETERFLEAAEHRGLDADTARGVARGLGYTLPVPGQGSWSPLYALPGAPTTMDTAAMAILQSPAQGYEAIKSGAVLAWLRANDASPDVLSRSREARQVADRGDAEALVLHTQAWALGVRVLVVGTTWLRSPGEIAPAVRRGAIVLDDLSRAAREGTLGAWLRAQGWAAAAGAADLVARGEVTGMKRLAWSLGEPLVLGDTSVGDPASLARVVLARPELREPLMALYASGDLLAWLESLPPVLRDEQWIDRLRRARTDPRRAQDQLPVWRGIYQHARASSFTVRDKKGNPVVLASVAQLRVTPQVAELWDALKQALRTGELLAWLEGIAPEVARPVLPRPPRDEDNELNALLWAFGHQGLVLEWGADDLAIVSPSDLVRAYERSWQQFEAQVARGYVLDWLERFHGGVNVFPSAPGAPSVAMRDAVAWLRGEAGRLPAGHLALKLALLCGMRHLPLDPTLPGDRATFRGYTHVTGTPGGDRRRWEPLRDQVLSGSAVLWVALSNATDAITARTLFHEAFLAPTQARSAQHGDEVIGMLARSFGEPIPSPALARDLTEPSARDLPHPVARAPRSRSRGLMVLAGLVALGGMSLGAWSWWTARLTADPPEPPAPPGREEWVQMRVRLEADRTRLGRPWDADGSAPDLRGTVRPRGELVTIGPCEESRRCEGTLNAVRLVPGVPFRVAVDEMDWVLPDRVGGAWILWQGSREETSRVRIGAVEVTVSVKRLAFQPSAVSAPSAGAAPTRTSPSDSKTPPHTVFPPRPLPVRRAPLQEFPLSTRPELVSFLQAWNAQLDAMAQRHPNHLGVFYAEQARLRGSRNVLRTRAGVEAYWQLFFHTQGGTIRFDWTRATVVTEPLDTARESHSACQRVTTEDSTVTLVRVPAVEDNPRSGVETLNGTRCTHIEGMYLLRMMRVEDTWQICHDTWSLEEAICPSCPSARSCRSSTLPRASMGSEDPVSWVAFATHSPTLGPITSDASFRAPWSVQDAPWEGHLRRTCARRAPRS